MKYLLFLLFSLIPLQAQTLLQGDFWLDAGLLGYSPWEMEDWIVPQNVGRYNDEEISGELYPLLLEDVRYILSAALYGWEVTYRPGDAARDVEEYFKIELNQQIPWGDPSLIITRSWQEESRFYIHAEYRLDDRENLRYQSTMSNRYQDSGGRAEGTAFTDNPRRVALEQSIKESLRHFLRPRVRNMPRQISGRVYLRNMPMFTAAPAGYTCQSMVKLDLDPLVEYPIGY
ncbi:MAG: hypothetical protein PF447_07260 [Spirochaetaceae bacterium]|jgi:hypothetical protein|nr:hypothetical protein [Spirochaetaceae bacterium]